MQPDIHQAVTNLSHRGGSPPRVASDAEMLRAIRELSAAGTAPTIRELAQELGYRAWSGALYRVRTLARRGLLEVGFGARRSTRRSLVLTAQAERLLADRAELPDRATWPLWATDAYRHGGVVIFDCT